ncbi:P-loop containing nucleoside triphosphate hydrolase protein [Xylogone sp. PMI_703]|nr:P-loop containing nucleoside triphosphate hydrolase protein [Xylogone sp. PMI_703]
MADAAPSLVPLDSATSNAAVNPTIIDDKSPICIPFILKRLAIHREENPSRPFIIGLNGVQGAGKTTLVSALSHTLRVKEKLETLVVSIDDFYLPHAEQGALAREHKDNPLVQHRGEPGTHDVALLKSFFEAIRDGREIKVPVYDKSAFQGQGDRVSEDKWQVVNAPGQPRIQVVIFEGWCAGFRALSTQELIAKQTAAKEAAKTSTEVKTLHKHRTEDLLFVNEKLSAYDVVTDMFDAFIHIDAEETGYVYEWRLQQEAALRKEKGTGMTDEQVIKFVDGYYPAYELYTDVLRAGVVRDKEARKGSQLRMVVGRDRRVKQVYEI